MGQPQIVCGQVAGDIVDYGSAMGGRHYQLLTLDHNSMSIHDPRYDESGIHGVSPKYYGVTQSFVDRFIALNSSLIEQSNLRVIALDSMINASVASVQSSLGVPEGDLASHFFNDSDLEFEVEKVIGQRLAEYAAKELESLAAQPKANRSVGPSFG